MSKLNLYWRKAKRFFYRYTPRYMTGLFHIDRSDQPYRVTWVIPGDSVVLGPADYLLEQYFFNLFGWPVQCRPLRSYSIPK